MVGIAMKTLSLLGLATVSCSPAVVPIPYEEGDLLVLLAVFEGGIELGTFATGPVKREYPEPPIELHWWTIPENSLSAPPSVEVTALSASQTVPNGFGECGRCSLGEPTNTLLARPGDLCPMPPAIRGHWPADVEPTNQRLSLAFSGRCECATDEPSDPRPVDIEIEHLVGSEQNLPNSSVVAMPDGGWALLGQQSHVSISRDSTVTRIAPSRLPGRIRAATHLASGLLVLADPDHNRVSLTLYDSHLEVLAEAEILPDVRPIHVEPLEDDAFLLMADRQFTGGKSPFLAICEYDREFSCRELLHGQRNGETRTATKAGSLTAVNLVDAPRILLFEGLNATSELGTLAPLVGGARIADLSTGGWMLETPMPTDFDRMAIIGRRVYLCASEDPAMVHFEVPTEKPTSALEVRSLVLPAACGSFVAGENVNERRVVLRSGASFVVTRDGAMSADPNPPHRAGVSFQAVVATLGRPTEILGVDWNEAVYRLSDPPRKVYGADPRYSWTRATVQTADGPLEIHDYGELSRWSDGKHKIETMPGVSRNERVLDAALDPETNTVWMVGFVSGTEDRTNNREVSGSLIRSFALDSGESKQISLPGDPKILWAITKLEDTWLVASGEIDLFRLTETGLEDIPIQWDDPLTIESESEPNQECQTTARFFDPLTFNGSVTLSSSGPIAWMNGCNGLLVRITKRGDELQANRVAIPNGIVDPSALLSTCPGEAVMAARDQDRVRMFKVEGARAEDYGAPAPRSIGSGVVVSIVGDMTRPLLLLSSEVPRYGEIFDIRSARTTLLDVRQLRAVQQGREVFVPVPDGRAVRLTLD